MSEQSSFAVIGKSLRGPSVPGSSDSLLSLPEAGKGQGGPFSRHLSNARATSVERGDADPGSDPPLAADGEDRVDSANGHPSQGEGTTGRDSTSAEQVAQGSHSRTHGDDPAEPAVASVRAPVLARTEKSATNRNAELDALNRTPQLEQEAVRTASVGSVQHTDEGGANPNTDRTPLQSPAQVMTSVVGGSTADESGVNVFGAPDDSGQALARSNRGTPSQSPPVSEGVVAAPRIAVSDEPERRGEPSARVALERPTGNVPAVNPAGIDATVGNPVTSVAATVDRVGSGIANVPVVLAAELSATSSSELTGVTVSPPVNVNTLAGREIVPGAEQRSPISAQAGTASVADLPVIMKSGAAREAMAERLASQPRSVTQITDRANVGAPQPAEGGAFNLPANMFHAISGGTLTAAHATRMDATAASPLAPHVVNLQMGHADGSLSENVRWQVDNKLRTVTVNVTPAGMGPVSINVVMESEQMNVSIVASQGSTREALEAALPRLREQLVQQGNEQVNVNVRGGYSGHSGHSDSSDRHADSDAGRPRSAEPRSVSSSDSIDDSSIRTGRALMCGLVDAYA